jgi:hypothetical protein
VIETEGRLRRASTLVVSDLAIGAGDVAGRVSPTWQPHPGQPKRCRGIGLMLTPNRRPATSPRAMPQGVGPGIVLAVAAALISGLAIYLNASAVKQLPDAAVYTTLRNGVSAAILILLALPLGAARDMRRIPRSNWPAIMPSG